MGTLSIRWMVKVVLYAAVVGVLVALNILWHPRPIQRLPDLPPAPLTVRPLLDQCHAGGTSINEVQSCEQGWAIFRNGLSPQVFDAAGRELCPSKDISDTSTSDCLRTVSDQVGRCSVACNAPSN